MRKSEGKMLQKTSFIVISICYLIVLSCTDDKIEAGTSERGEDTNTEDVGQTSEDLSSTDSNSGSETDSGSEASADSDTDTDTDTDTDSDTDADADTDKDLFVRDTDTNPKVCAAFDFDVSPPPVRLMILEDKSGSMDMDRRGGDTSIPSKWDQAKEALNAVMTKYEYVIDFGLDVFPNNENCGVNQPLLFDCSSGQREKILDTLNALAPNGGTPLLRAMNNFLNTDYAPVFLDGRHPSYLLVVSDGQDTCDDETCAPGLFVNRCAASVDALADAAKALADKDIKTFVIGFGDGVDPDQLNAIASNGGTGFDEYFVADDSKSLEDALTKVGIQIMGCVYDIEKQKEDDVNMDEANFYFDGEVVGRDNNCEKGKGWTWVDDTYTKVEFCEEACNMIKTRKVDKIDAKFGCPSIPVL